MAWRRIEPDEWQTWIDDVADRVLASRVEVHVDSLDIGDQLEIDRLLLQGIAFDPRDRALDLEFEHLGHRIGDIGEMWADERDGVLRAIGIRRNDGALETIEFLPVARIEGPPPSGPEPRA